MSTNSSRPLDVADPFSPHRSSAPISTGPTNAAGTAIGVGAAYRLLLVGADRSLLARLSTYIEELGYEVDQATKDKLDSDDVELMLFGQRFLAQVMFGDNFIPMRPDAYERRAAKKAEREARLDEIVEKIGPLPTTPPPEPEDPYRSGGD